MTSKTLTARLPRRGAMQLSLIALALFVMPFVAFTSTAKAAISDCPNNRVCMWVDTYGNGYRYDLAYNGAGWCTNMPPSMNDVISSVYNRLSTKVRFYEHVNCGGEMFELQPGTYRNTMPLGWNIWNFNDVVSSIKFY